MPRTNVNAIYRAKRARELLGTLYREMKAWRAVAEYLGIPTHGGYLSHLYKNENEMPNKRVLKALGLMTRKLKLRRWGAVRYGDQPGRLGDMV